MCEKDSIKKLINKAGLLENIKCYSDLYTFKLQRYHDLQNL